MNKVNRITIKGEDYALIPWEDYEDLADIAAFLNVDMEMLVP